MKIYTNFVLSLLLIISSGCASKNIAESPEAVEKLTPFITIEQVNEVVITKESKTDIPTELKIPALSPEEAMELVMDLYENNGGCELPCWWGITPGITSWHEAYKILAPLGDIYTITDPISGITLNEFDTYLPEDIESLGRVGANLIVEDNIVIRIGTNSRWVMRSFDYSLPGLLNSLGMPTEIWISPVFVPIPDLSHYEMVLYYSQIGAIVRLNGKATTQENVMTICPQDKYRESNFPPGLSLWYSKDILSFEQFTRSSLGEYYTLNIEIFERIENLQNTVDNEWFYDTYKDPASEDCFNIEV